MKASSSSWVSGRSPRGATAIEPSRVAVRLVDNDLSTQTVALSSGGEILLSRDGTGPWMLDAERAENGTEVARNDQIHVLELADGQWRLARYAIRSVVGETSVEDGVAATLSVLFDPEVRNCRQCRESLRGRHEATTEFEWWTRREQSPRWLERGTGVSAETAALPRPPGLASPFGLALDREGNLYLSDSGNHRVRRIDAATRTIETVAGTGQLGFSVDGGPAVAAEVVDPRGIAMDDSGNVLVAERATSRVRRIDTVTGTIDTVAGTGARGHSGDGGPATEGMLHSPQGVAADLSGNLYVADTWNHRLRRIDHATGVIETLAGGGGPGFSGDGRSRLPGTAPPSRRGGSGRSRERLRGRHLELENSANRCDVGSDRNDRGNRRGRVLRGRRSSNSGDALRSPGGRRGRFGKRVHCRHPEPQGASHRQRHADNQFGRRVRVTDRELDWRRGPVRRDWMRRSRLRWPAPETCCLRTRTASGSSMPRE